MIHITRFKHTHNTNQKEYRHNAAPNPIGQPHNTPTQSSNAHRTRHKAMLNPISPQNGTSAQWAGWITCDPPLDAAAMERVIAAQSAKWVGWWWWGRTMKETAGGLNAHRLHAEGTFCIGFPGFGVFSPLEAITNTNNLIPMENAECRQLRQENAVARSSTQNSTAQKLYARIKQTPVRAVLA